MFNDIEIEVIKEVFKKWSEMAEDKDKYYLEEFEDSESYAESATNFFIKLFEETYVNYETN